MTKAETLPILFVPDKRLRLKARPIGDADGDKVRALADKMLATMYAAPGIGLAATQVNAHLRVIVIDVSETKDALQVFINPEILEAEGESDCEEGCLSVPGIYEKVRRAERIKVRALDQQGEPFALDADGLLAVCIQHEMDHLQGKVFVEYLSPLKQLRLQAKLRKRRKETM
jgi:peptide deformylase